MQCTIDVTYVCWRGQILAKVRNLPNSPNIIPRQNLLIYSIWRDGILNCRFGLNCLGSRLRFHKGDDFVVVVLVLVLAVVVGFLDE